MTKLIIRHAPRHSDDNTLLIIEQKRLGKTWAQAGEVVGLSGPAAQNAASRVLTDDIKFSGEPEAQVRAEYW